MKKVLVLMGVALLAANVAVAQLDPDLDGIGVFFDQAGTVRCGTTAPSTMFFAYVTATNLSRTTMAGFEVKVTVDAPGLMLTGATLPYPGSLNAATAPEFYVGFGYPQERQPAMVCAILNYFVMAPTPATFKVGPVTYYRPSIEGVPCYGDAELQLIPFQAPTGNWTDVCASLNLPCDIVNVDDATWGGVKGMFK